MATLTPAQVMGVDKDRGVIAAGKLGGHDPDRRRPDEEHSRHLDNVTTVIKGGKVYDPAAIEKAMGIAPRRTGS